MLCYPGWVLLPFAGSWYCFCPLSLLSYFSWWLLSRRVKWNAKTSERRNKKKYFTNLNTVAHSIPMDFDFWHRLNVYCFYSKFILLWHIWFCVSNCFRMCQFPFGFGFLLENFDRQLKTLVYLFSQSRYFRFFCFICFYFFLLRSC